MKLFLLQLSSRPDPRVLLQEHFSKKAWDAESWTGIIIVLAAIAVLVWGLVGVPMVQRAMLEDRAVWVREIDSDGARGPARSGTSTAATSMSPNRASMACRVQGCPMTEASPCSPSSAAGPTQKVRRGRYGWRTRSAGTGCMSGRDGIERCRPFGTATSSSSR